MIINFVADKNPEDELFQNLRNGSVNQKFIYFDSGAAGYYSNEYYLPPSEEFVNFARAKISGINLINDNQIEEKSAKKTAVISLGCGNSFEESRILANSHQDVTYFAIDSSSTMLELSEKILENFDFNKVLIQADFTTASFRENLEKLLADFDRRIFYISGFTFGNFDSSLVTLLYSLMKPGDELIFYAVAVVDLHLYQKLFIKDSKETLKNKGKMQAYFNPIKKFDVSVNSGKIIVEYCNEKDIGALCLQYFYQFNRKTKIKHKNESIKFFPGQKILIQTIRVYDYDFLRAFFKYTGFIFQELEVSENINVCFVFQKALTPGPSLRERGEEEKA